MNNKVYELNHNIQRLGFMERGDAYDLKAFEFLKMSEIRNIHENRTLDLPETVFFYVYSKRNYVEDLDSLHSLQTSCIYSRRMIDALLSVTDFEYGLYPVAVLEYREIEGKNLDPYEKSEFYTEKSLRSDLFLFQTLEFLDVFDWEKSNYKQSELSKEVGSPGRVEKYVFREPSLGFPPLFRLPYQPAHLFISAEAREALKKNGIKGTAFAPLDNIWQSEIDVPIT